MTDLTQICRDLVPNYDPWRDAEGYEFYSDVAQRYIDFIEQVTTHTKGDLAGKPVLLEDWQKAFVGNIFGWLSIKTGKRRYREALLYIPRKNGKTLISASIANALFFIDGEKGAEVYCAGAEKEQASLLWRMARQQIENEPELEKRCKIYTASKSIYKESDGSVFNAISADANTKHGFNAHAVLADELHAHKSSELFEVLETSTGARSQPLIIGMTTADYARPSLCNQKYEYAKNVCSGTIRDAQFFPVVYEISRDDEWTDPKCWRKANPNLGVSVTYEYLEKQCKKAQEMPSFENTFKRLHLNLQTEGATRWLQLEAWDKCEEPLDIATLAGAVCYGGLDLSSTTDLSSLILYFPDYKVLLSRFWVPEEGALARQKRDKVPYLDWIRDGFMIATEGNVIDYRFIRQEINDLCALYDVRLIGYDPFNARQLAIQLETEDGVPMAEFRQGFISMNEPCKSFERAVMSKDLNHLGHPVLRWNAQNVVVATDPSGNYRPDKKKSSEKIDGIVSAIMALGCSLLNAQESGRSVYEERGMITF